MKLWQKIFLWALLTAMLAVSTLGVLLLKNNFKSSMIRQTESTLSCLLYTSDAAVELDGSVRCV